MSGKNEAIKGRTAEGVTFDPAQLMQSILTTIERFRSDVGTSPGQIVENTLDMSANESVESRLNCFYRLLGLPATRDMSKAIFEPSVAAEERNRKLSQHGTLNYYDDKASVGQVVSSRETSLIKSIENRTVQDNIAMIKDPLPLEKLGLEQNSFATRKPSIYPMVVDAATPVFPIQKRVAPLFYDGDFIVSGSSENTRLPRPLLESILYMRTNRFQVDMSSKIEMLTNNIQSFVQGLPSTIELSPEQTVERSELLESIGIKNGQADFTLIEAEIINKFIQAIGQSARKYKAVINDAKELNQKVLFKPEPKKSAQEKSGNSTVILEATGNNPSIDARIKELEQEKSELDLLLTLLPTNRVLQADTTYRIATNQEGFANITPDVFISEFSGLVTFDLDSINKQLREENTKRARSIQKFEVLRRNIQYYSGEGQGLSIFDILCTFLALFTIDLDKLVGLLNNDARSRMQSNKFFSFPNALKNKSIERSPLFSDEERLQKIEDVLTGKAILSVSDATKELEKAVKNNFKLAAAFFKDADRSGQGRKG